MPYSTCCGAYSTMPEIDICPECRDHCDWEDEDDDEPSDDQINNNHNTEGGILFSTPAWNGR